MGEPWSCVHRGDGYWVTVRASRLGDDVAVTIETAPAGERIDLWARASTPDGRETEVLSLLVGGMATCDIAAALVVPNTPSTTP